MENRAVLDLQITPVGGGGVFGPPPCRGRLVLGPIITPTQQDRLAVKGGVAWLFRQGFNLTPRRLGVVEVVSRSRVASLANPDASGRVLAGGGGAIAGAKASEDATEEEHQGVTGRARALANHSRGWAWGRSPAVTL